MSPATADDATATELLADFSIGLTADRVPAAVRDGVGLHLLDVLGCGLAAVATHAAPYAAALAEGAGPATALGVTAKLPPETAALINGILCHALDFDDTHPRSIAHVSAVVVPAALAAAEAVGADGERLALALLVGDEVTCRVGRPVGDAFHLRGFHPTAICGVFGATAAVARLHRLDRDKTVEALGIAGSMAAGLMAYLSDGSATKQIHPGWMAHAAHCAVKLAGSGGTGPAAVLEGSNGVYRAFLGREDVGATMVVEGLGTEWEAATIAFKPYAGCHFLHAPLDALLALRAEHGFAADDVARIVVRSPEAGIGLIGEPRDRKQRPATSYEAKFSAPFAFAAALVLDRTDPGVFAEEHLGDPAVLALAARVEPETVEFATFPRSLPGGVRVELRDGRVLERDVLHQRGGVGNLMSSAEIVAKFRENAGLALPEPAVGELERACLELAELRSLDPFGALAASAGAPT
ncbi:MAG: MmgE/PrpD family protein [Actinobacteria bacterium]|nr:MmgE/PrpD family protein [Actinomycetota bacterium]